MSCIGPDEGFQRFSLRLPAGTRMSAGLGLIPDIPSGPGKRLPVLPESTSPGRASVPPDDPTPTGFQVMLQCPGFSVTRPCVQLSWQLWVVVSPRSAAQAARRLLWERQEISIVCAHVVSQDLLLGTRPLCQARAWDEN